MMSRKSFSAAPQTAKVKRKFPLANGRQDAELEEEHVVRECGVVKVNVCIVKKLKCENNDGCRRPHGSALTLLQQHAKVLRITEHRPHAPAFKGQRVVLANCVYVFVGVCVVEQL